MTRIALLKRLKACPADSDWRCRTEKNGIGDYGRDEHYRMADDSIQFGVRITYCPPKFTILYFKEVK